MVRLSVMTMQEKYVGFLRAIIDLQCDIRSNICSHLTEPSLIACVLWSFFYRGSLNGIYV